MSRLIQNLHIQNFKSIRDLKLDCDRINIFIGKPNAGKSNILEAISLLGTKYSTGDKFMSEFIRYNRMSQLFSNYNYRQSIVVKSDTVKATLKADEAGSAFDFSVYPEPKSAPSGKGVQLVPLNSGPVSLTEKRISIDGTIRPAISADQNKLVKRYTFKLIGDYQERGLFLQPPYGENFYLIVRSLPELHTEISQFLKPNGLELLFDEGSQHMMVVQKTDTTLVSFPLHLVPDTFQRYIFHLAAILSNQDSVLLFEEPESHSYPPYIYQLAQHILQDDRNNQFFLTTHNPYLLTPILEETKDVALFVTWYEDFQTHARKLSPEEIREVLNDGLDVFLNLNHFVPEHE